MGQVIAIVGNPLSGFRFIGPFASEQEAYDFLKKSDEDEYWRWVATLEEPTLISTVGSDPSRDYRSIQDWLKKTAKEQLHKTAFGMPVHVNEPWTVEGKLGAVEGNVYVVQDGKVVGVMLGEKKEDEVEKDWKTIALDRERVNNELLVAIGWTVNDGKPVEYAHAIKAKLAALEPNLRAQSQAIEELRKERDAAQALANDLLRDRHRAIEQEEITSRDRDTYRQACAEWAEQAKRLQEDLTKAEEALTIACVRAEHAEQDNAILEQACSEADMEVQEQNDVIDRLRANATNAEIERLRETIEHMQEDRAGLDHALRANRKSREDALQRERDTRAELDALREQINTAYENGRRNAMDKAQSHIDRTDVVPIEVALTAMIRWGNMRADANLYPGSGSMTPRKVLDAALSAVQPAAAKEDE